MVSRKGRKEDAKNAEKTLTWTDLVNRGVRMIDAPVEPVIFQHKNFLQLTPCEWSSNRLTFEIPGAAGFGVNQLQLRLLGCLLKKLQPPPIDRAFKSARRALVLTPHQH